MTDHGVIQTNLTLLIHTHLRAAGARCRLVQTPGIRSHIASDWNHRVPEMAVTCSPNRSSTSSLIDPLLVIEILSKTNAAATWSNIPLYASLPSVQEVLVVDSRKLEALVLRRGADGHWPPNPEAADPAHGCRLASIDLTLPFAEIYAQTEVWTRSHGADPATE
jgi:Uma2 family endonuclease